MTIKVYDSKVYGKTVDMGYGTIEDEGCTVICVGCAINIVHLSFPIVPHANGVFGQIVHVAIVFSRRFLSVR